MIKQFKAYFRAIINIIKTFNLSYTSLLKSPGKLLAATQGSLFLLKQIKNKGLKPMEVQEFFGEKISTTEVRILYNTYDMWFSERGDYFKDLVSLCFIIKAVNPQKIFEIGTSVGVTSTMFSLNSDPTCEIFTLDLPINYEPFEVELNTTIVDDKIMSSRKKHRYLWEDLDHEFQLKIRLIHGDSATFDYTDYNGQIDFFYIDGAHSYDYVKSDTSKAFECIKPNGVIAWHDYGREGINGVSRYLEELSNDIQIYRVPGSSVAFTVADESVSSRFQ